MLYIFGSVYIIRIALSFFSIFFSKKLQKRLNIEINTKTKVEQMDEKLP